MVFTAQSVLHRITILNNTLVINIIIKVKIISIMMGYNNWVSTQVCAAILTVFSVAVGMSIGLYGQLPFPKVITDF